MKGLNPSPVPYHQYLRNGSSTPDVDSKFNSKVSIGLIKSNYETNKKHMRVINSHRKYSSGGILSDSGYKSDSSRFKRNFIKENARNPCLKSYDSAAISKKLQEVQSDEGKTFGKFFPKTT